MVVEAAGAAVGLLTVGAVGQTKTSAPWSKALAKSRYSRDRSC